MPIKNLTSIEIMRVLVLIAAVLLWLNVYGFQNRQIVVMAPLAITGLSETLAIVEPLVGVEVKLSGNSRELALVSQDTLNFTIDLATARAVGEFEVDVKLHTSPRGVEIISFAPTNLTLTLNERTTKVVPVSIALSGAVASGYHVERTVLAQENITISGAGDLLTSISEATLQINLSGQSRSFTTVGEVILLDSQNRRIYNVGTAPKSISVEVQILQGVATRTLGISPQFVGSLPGGYWVREVVFEPAVLTVEGDDATLKSLQFLTSTPIHLADKRESFYEQVGIELDRSLNLLGSKVATAYVIVERSRSTKQLNIVPTFENIGEGLSASAIEPASIRVVVSGEAETLANLSSADVVLKINLAGALSGQNVIGLREDMFTTSPNLAVVSFSPASLEIILSRS